MAPKDPKISKHSCWHIKGQDKNSLETIETFTKPGSATSQSIIMTAHNIGLLNTSGTKKDTEKMSCKNLGQYRYRLINGLINDLAPLQSCRCQVTEIVLHMHLKLVWHLGHILPI